MFGMRCLRKMIVSCWVGVDVGWGLRVSFRLRLVRFGSEVGIGLVLLLRLFLFF